MKDYLKENRNWWNKATTVHAKSKLYDLERWKAGERTNLMPLEIEELGDVRGKTLLNLQCHFGMGTLDWAKLGAEATGVDLSDESIKLANELSEEIKIPARFICSDIYDLPNILDEKFDIVFTSYGVLAWLPDIKKWAKVINHFLKEGGIFYIVEIHPFTDLFDKDFKVTDSYFRKEPYIENVASPDYADDQSIIEGTTHEWSHPLSDIVNALIEVGLKIEFLHEFPFTVYNQFPGLVEQDKQEYFHFKDGNIQVPLLFSIKASK